MSSIRFCCPHCRATIKAPAEISGQCRNCPGCGETFVVPRAIPEDAGAVLVLLEREERLALALTPRTGARPTAAGYRLRRTA